MDEIKEFKMEVERFLKSEKMKPTVLSRGAGVTTAFVEQIRLGREPRLATRKKVVAFMRKHMKAKAK